MAAFGPTGLASRAASGQWAESASPEVRTVSSYGTVTALSNVT
jgi:hypothetical protein